DRARQKECGRDDEDVQRGVVHGLCIRAIRGSNENRLRIGDRIPAKRASIVISKPGAMAKSPRLAPSQMARAISSALFTLAPPAILLVISGRTRISSCSWGVSVSGGKTTETEMPSGFNS